MAMNKIQKSDTVVVLAGKEKGKTGVVQKLDGDYAVVEGLNMLTHYVKRDQQRGVNRQKPGFATIITG